MKWNDFLRNFEEESHFFCTRKSLHMTLGLHVKKEASAPKKIGSKVRKMRMSRGITQSVSQYVSWKEISVSARV